MSVLEILRWPDTRLSMQCAPVGVVTDDTRTLASDMLETMYAAPGRGLAAPQVGVLKRLFVMDVTWKAGQRAPEVFVDREIVEAGAEVVENDEGCLSIPGVTAAISRPSWVVMAWRDLHGKEQQRRFDGFAAACVQHELDHLNGTVTLDRVAPDARERILQAYREVSA